MNSPDKQYSRYIAHPRFGRSPRFTGYDPDPSRERVLLSWWCVLPNEDHPDDSDDGFAILGTAIHADQSAQHPMTFQFTHYYDIDRSCVDCGHRFIFFAEEQKHWYETLKFYGGVNCVRCIECRKKRQNLAKAQRTYASLLQKSELAPEDLQRLIDSGLELIEAGLAGRRCYNQLQFTRRKYPDIILSDEVYLRIHSAKIKTRQQVASADANRRSTGV
jgi:hypothetical protein